MRHFIMIFAIIFSTAACSSWYRHEISVPGRNAANNPVGVEVGARANGTASPEVEDICEVESLNSRYASYKRSIKDIGTAYTYDKKGRVRSEAPISDVEIEKTYADRGTRRRISRFELELDAAYQATMTSCRSYARCMQNNFYDEGQCRSNMTSWEQSREDFADLARELSEIEAEVKRDRIGRGYRRGAYVNKHERCDCSDSVGGVFANCCDKDSDYHYSKNY